MKKEYILWGICGAGVRAVETRCTGGPAVCTRGQPGHAVTIRGWGEANPVENGRV